MVEMLSNVPQRVACDTRHLPSCTFAQLPHAVYIASLGYDRRIELLRGAQDGSARRGKQACHHRPWRQNRADVDIGLKGGDRGALRADYVDQVAQAILAFSRMDSLCDSRKSGGRFLYAKFAAWCCDFSPLRAGRDGEG